MKKLAAWRLWLDGCTVCLAMVGTLHAAAPPTVVIASPEEAHAFADDAPFVFSGQSLVVESGFTTDRAIDLQSLAPIFVSAGERFELSGVVSSSAPRMTAPLEKRGAGTLVLSGANAYTSNTVLREGVLQVSGSSPLASSIYNLEQHAGTVLQIEAGTRLVNYVQLNATRPGDTPLPDRDGVAEWRVESGLATMVNNVNAAVPVRKTGEGGLRLTGVLQGRTPVDLRAGALVVDGTVTGRVEVAAGARLEGSGDLAGARIHRGGRVVPGGLDAAATLSSWGDFVFEPGGLYHVNAYPDGRSDFLDLIGEARLDGHVWAEAGAGEWAPEQRYLILSARGGLADSRFAGVDANLAFLDPTLEYDDTRVYLALRRNDLGVGDVGETPDEKEVGDVIDPPAPPVPEPEKPGPEKPGPEKPGPEKPGPETPPPPAPETPSEPGTPDTPDTPDTEIPVPETPDEPSAPDSPTSMDPDTSAAPVDMLPPAPPPIADAGDVRPLTPLQRAVLGLSADQARAALRNLSGSWHASVRSFVMEDSRYVRDAVLAGAPGGHGAWRNEDPRSTGLRSWSHAYMARGRRGGGHGVDGDRHSSRGMIVGMDAMASRHWRVGGLFAAQHGELKRNDAPASASVASHYAAVTAHGRWSGMRVTAGLLHAWHRIKSQRRVSAGPLQNVLNATYTGRSWQAVLEIAPRLRTLREWGAGLRAATPRMGPYLRHDWMRLRAAGWQESGGPAAHDVRGSRTDMHATTLGWRLRHDFDWSGRPAGWQADVGWRHVLGNPELTSTQRFVGTEAAPDSAPSRAFTSRGQPLVRDALAFGLAINAQPWRKAQLSARYSGLYGRAYRDHAAWAELSWTF